MPDFLPHSPSRRPSASRRAVIEAVATLEPPFTIGELLAAAQRIAPGLGRSAVYRTVGWLETQGCLRPLTTPSRRTVYTASRSPAHCVVECHQCGATHQIDDAALADHARNLAKREGFTMARAQWKVAALCPDANHEKMHPM